LLEDDAVARLVKALEAIDASPGYEAAQVTPVVAASTAVPALTQKSAAALLALIA
jgi:hypothetical protein